MSERHDELTWLRLPAVMPSLAEFHAFTQEGARRAELPESSVHKLDLLIEELVVNVIHYAYSEGDPGEAEVGYAVLPSKRLRVDIRDAGRAFNPLAAEDPDVEREMEERPVGGLGIYLVKTMADAIAYRREDGKNVVSFELS